MKPVYPCNTRHDLSFLSLKLNLCNEAHTNFVIINKHNNINTAPYRTNEQTWGVDNGSEEPWTPELLTINKTKQGGLVSILSHLIRANEIARF